MLAMVLGALAPTVAHAWVAAADEGQWIEVCSASGMVWLKAGALDGSEDPATDTGTDMPMADMSAHCPWCSFHGPSAALPPVAPETAAIVQAGYAMPGWRDQAWLHQQVTIALARAPPVAS